MDQSYSFISNDLCRMLRIIPSKCPSLVESTKPYILFQSIHLGASSPSHQTLFQGQPPPPPPLQLASSKWSRTHFGTHHTSFEAQILPILRGSSLHLDSELNKDKPEANRSGPVLFYYLPINYPESKAQIGWVWVRIMQRSALLVCHMENETLLF